MVLGLWFYITYICDFLKFALLWGREALNASFISLLALPLIVFDLRKPNASLDWIKKALEHPQFKIKLSLPLTLMSVIILLTHEHT